MKDMPMANISGISIPGDYACNPKGSITPEMLQQHSKYLDVLRAHHNKPDAWVVALIDGV